MIIDLASIEASPKKINIVFEPTEIDLADASAKLTGKVEFMGETERVAGKPHIRATIKAGMALACTRCLESVERHLEIQFEDVFIEAGDESRIDEAELAVEELDESPAVEGGIDLAEVIREQIVLAVPNQVFCHQDCKGLCQKCGANQNLIDCKCADDDIDPRWAALKDLR